MLREDLMTYAQCLLAKSIKLIPDVTQHRLYHRQIDAEDRTEIAMLLL